MPKFEVLSLEEGMRKTATLQREKIYFEYKGYIDRLQLGEAGMLKASEGESATAIIRRLGKTAKDAGVDLTIKRNCDEVIFWLNRRKRGRPRKINFPLR